MRYIQYDSVSKMVAIQVENLVMTYGDGTKAVKGISFGVDEGEFFGFLGPNGAGKSTTIKILTTLLRKTSGSVKVAGHDVEHDAQTIRKLIGVQMQDTVIDEDLTGRENLMLQGHLQSLHGEDLRTRVNELLKIVDLEGAANKRAAYYSGGMKKRLDLASTLVHQPRLLFLDEPTTGLDPQTRATVWSYLKQLNQEQGITIFITTQYLEEVDRLCRRLAILDHGEIVAKGSPAELKQEIGADAITLGFGNGTTGNGTAREKAKQILTGLSGVTNIVDADGGVVVYAKNGGFMVPDIVRAFDGANIRLSSIGVSTPTLDDVFLKHTGRRIRPEELDKSRGSGRMFSRRR